MRCPCKDCKDRAVNCHAGCERYGEYARERESIRKARQECQLMHSKFSAKYIRKWEGQSGN